LHRPLRSKSERHVYSISSTPTDCVAVGINKILSEKPAFVVSGINRAPISEMILLFGTVSAAIESTIMGIPAFAVSLVITNQTGPLYFDTAARIATQIGRYILEHSLPYDTLFNVNVPDVPIQNIKGIKLTRQGKRIYDDAIQETFDPHGEKHYWIGGGKPYWEHGEDTDIQAVQDNCISVTRFILTSQTMRR
jgi:5'-nucleotidase